MADTNKYIKSRTAIKQKTKTQNHKTKTQNHKQLPSADK
jgi:hypothetical protein